MWSGTDLHENAAPPYNFVDLSAICACELRPGHRRSCGLNGAEQLAHIWGGMQGGSLPCSPWAGSPGTRTAAGTVKARRRPGLWRCNIINFVAPSLAGEPAPGREVVRCSGFWAVGCTGRRFATALHLDDSWSWYFYQMFLRLGLFLLQNYAHVHQSIPLESVQGLLIN